MTDREEEEQTTSGPIPDSPEVCGIHPVRVGTFKKDCVYCSGRLMAPPMQGHIIEKRTF